MMRIKAGFAVDKVAEASKVIHPRCLLTSIIPVYIEVKK